MTRMGRIFTDLIRVAPLDPPDLRSIALQIGKLNSPAIGVILWRYAKIPA